MFVHIAGRTFERSDSRRRSGGPTARRDADTHRSAYHEAYQRSISIASHTQANDLLVNLLLLGAAMALDAVLRCARTISVDLHRRRV
jgi:hypothetical protein